MNKYKQVTNRVHGGSIKAHIAIAERVLGRPLKDMECIHHVDKDGFNTENSNLVICPDYKYHKLLHIRADAYDACGDVHARACMYCKQHDETKHMTFISRGKDSYYYHKQCATRNYQENRERILENRRLRRLAGKRN